MVAKLSSIRYPEWSLLLTAQQAGHGASLATTADAVAADTAQVRIQQVVSSMEIESCVELADISRHLDDLNDTLARGQGPSLADVLLPLFIAVVGAGLVWWFNHLQWKYIRARDKTAQLAAATSVLVKELRTDAVGYWMSGTDNEEERKHNRVLETNLLAQLKEIRTLTETLGSSRNALEITKEPASPGPSGDGLGTAKEPSSPGSMTVRKCGSWFKRRDDAAASQVMDRVRKLNLELFDLVTGEEFESFQRSPDRKRAGDIATKCASMRAALAELDFRS